MHIETYSDRSKAPNPNGASHSSKAEKFSWARPNDPGEFRYIPKEKIQIDRRYQREEVSKAKVLDIARNWDWRFFGVLSVIERADGSYWSFDGGHRWRASHYRDDIRLLPCMVFKADQVQEEALAFVGTNTMKSNVSAYHVFSASVQAGEPNALETQALLDKYGFVATKDGAGGRSIAAIGQLSKMVKEDSVLADKVFGLCVEIQDGKDVISKFVMEAIFYVASNSDEDIFSGKWRQKFNSIGIAGIEAAIRREKHIVGKGGAAVSAKALVDLLNKGIRVNRLSLS